MKNMKIVTIIALAVVAWMVFVGCDDIFDQNKNTSNYYYDYDSYIEFVRGGTPQSGYNTTYGYAFDNFFSNPEWCYFESDKGFDVVEFTGGCLYNNRDVDVLVQFTLAVEDGTFEATFFEINGVAQTYDEMYTMLEAVFGEY